jgi:hypothetical protein
LRRREGENVCGMGVVNGMSGEILFGLEQGGKLLYRIGGGYWDKEFLTYHCVLDFKSVGGGEWITSCAQVGR